MNPSNDRLSEQYAVTIPADVEREDRILANLTARQLAILLPASALVWLAYQTTHTLLPFPVLAAFAVAVLSAAAALALAERDGVSLDRLLVHALKQQRAPRRLVLAPEQLPPLPGWAANSLPVSHPDAQPALAPLRLPAHAIRPDGAIDIGSDGAAALVACSTVSFALRTPAEQAGLVSAFGGWLNALTGPAQILVHAAPINLTPAISALRDRAGGLPHPALEDAAHDHADFLAELAATRELLARQVLVVLREPHGPTPSAARTATGGGRGRDLDGAAGRVLRRAEQTTRALAAAGITASVLDADQAAEALAAAADPTAPPMRTGRVAPGQPITATTRRRRRRQPETRREQRW